MKYNKHTSSSFYFICPIKEDFLNNGLIVLLDSDTAYSSCLCEYINIHTSLDYETMTFSQIDVFLDFSVNKQIDILLVNEDIFSSLPLYKISFLNLFILSETNFDSTIEKDSYTFSVFFKYQSMQSLLHKIMSHFSLDRHNYTAFAINHSAELQLTNIKNLVRLETRMPNIEGNGEITMQDLIKTSLRMRPDRIIVGEVRGKEASDMITVLNTGHSGSMSTGHANSAKDMLSRLETMILMGANLPISAIRGQIATGIDIIVHLGRLRDKSRRVLDIAEITAFDGNTITISSIFKFIDKDPASKVVKGSLEFTGHRLTNTEKLLLAGLAEPARVNPRPKKIDFFVPSNITSHYTCYCSILKAIFILAEERSATFSRHSKLCNHPSYLKNGSSVFHIISILSSPLIITFLITFWIFSLSKDSILMILSNCVSNLLEELSSGGISVLSCSIS